MRAPSLQLYAAFVLLAPGVEYAELSPFHVVRIDPKVATLTAIAASNGDQKPRTAAEWCKKEKLAVAINAGMFETDFSTHTGFFRADQHVNAKFWVSKYQSVLAFDHRGRAEMFDRDAGELPALESFDVVVQNLRLIKSPGLNVWPDNGKKWSEAAIAFDDRGRLLLVFSRAPFTMRDFNKKLSALPLGVVRAQHVEGGPEASLSIHAGGVNLDLSGSFETGFNENDDNQKQWPLPNVIGVVEEKK